MLVRLLVVVALCLLPSVVVAAEAEDLAPATRGQNSRRGFTTGTRFFDDADISGGVYFFRRDRRRYDVETKRYATNLNHATAQANVDFVSGFVGDHLGFDFGVFAAHDALNKGAVDHEMGFVPWGNPWHPDWSRRKTEDGASVYKAALKFRADSTWGNYWAKAGYFQPTGPGVLGVNWSIMPGTYRGLNAGADWGRLSLAVAWADEYKSPWYRNTNQFMKNDGETHVPWMWSAGAKYVLENGLGLELAYGSSKGHLKNAHFKGSGTVELGPGALDLAYHLYAMDDSDDSGRSENDNFDGIALQHYVSAAYRVNAWTLRLEGTLTRAAVSSPYQQGQFAYRLTDRNGSSKGAYEPWWDARSDWNADNEKAVFAGFTRTLDDLLPLAGFYVGAGAGIGFDGKAYDTAEHFKEWAFTFDAGYVKPDGPLEGAFVKLHYTEYRNGTDKPSWTPYRNGFQSERDLKLFVGIPFSL